MNLGLVDSDPANYNNKKAFINSGSFIVPKKEKAFSLWQFLCSKERENILLHQTSRETHCNSLAL